MTALIIFFDLLFAGLPIVATILAGAVAFMATNDLSVLFDSIPIQFYGALEINSLLAIPLFPLVVIAGIMLGIMTPTESGAVASIIALVLGFAYREIKVRDLGKIFLDVATNTATITGLIAAASVMSWALAFQGVPDLVVEWMKNLTDSPFVFLLLVIVMMLILGMFLESISVLIVVVPLLMPVVTSLGIDPIHFGVICTVATVIGLVTPPVGPGLYIAMVQADIRMGALFKATIPFLIAVLAVLILIAAVPQLSTWLPALMTSN